MSKGPIGSETTVGVCTLTIFPETLPVPRDLQKPSQQNANPSNFGELKCMCVREKDREREREHRSRVRATAARTHLEEGEGGVDEEGTRSAMSWGNPPTSPGSFRTEGRASQSLPVLC